MMLLVLLANIIEKSQVIRLGLFGGGNWDRTNDLMHVKHTL